MQNKLLTNFVNNVNKDPILKRNVPLTKKI